MADVAVLDVLLNGREIGSLTQVGGNRNLFAFTEDYINDPARPTLSLSFKDAYGELITDIRPTQTRVPPFFANLLPEGRLREYLAGRAGVNERRDFYLLWVLGQDLPGALVVRPADGEAWPPARGQDAADEYDDDHRHALRFSLAGVQLKLSAVMETRGGLTIPAQGVGGHWIIKLPSVAYDGLPENEFAMMTLARAVGIDVPDVQLHDLSAIAGLPEDIGRAKGQALAVRRFDRTVAGPVHMEDFAQVFGVYPERKYERASYRSIAKVIWIETGEQGIAEYVRRLVFNALIGNADMHLKNWTLIYPNGRDAALAPGYDFVSTIAFLPDENMALTFGHSKRFADFSTAELRYFAAKAQLPETIVLDAVHQTVQKFREVWSGEKTRLGLSASAREAIEKHVCVIPLAREMA